jgi:predicted nucleic acid-binding protein
MRAVSNTSPLSNLAIIGRLDLLKHRYGEVRIPPAVAAELSRLSHPVARTRLSEAFAEGWLIVDQPPAKLASLAFPLDPGEAQAIALAVDLRADILLMDERRGRASARLMGLTVAGVLGELLHAKLTGALQAIKPELNRLRTEARFFIDDEIERFILSQAGEGPG